VNLTPLANFCSPQPAAIAAAAAAAAVPFNFLLPAPPSPPALLPPTPRLDAARCRTSVSYDRCAARTQPPWRMAWMPASITDLWCGVRSSYQSSASDFFFFPGGCPSARTLRR